MTENGPDFVSETSFDNFPEFQRINNADGSFSLKAKKHERLVALDNCTIFILPRPGKGLVSTCNNKSFPEGKLRRKREEKLKWDDLFAVSEDGERGDENVNQNPVKEKLKLEPVSRNVFNFFGSPSQLRFYVAKKDLGIQKAPPNLYFLLAEESDLPKSANGTHYRPFKITGGQELHKQRTKFEKLLEVHNLEIADGSEIADGGNFVLDDKVNNKRFCHYYTYSHRYNQPFFGMIKEMPQFSSILINI